MRPLFGPVARFKAFFYRILYLIGSKFEYPLCLQIRTSLTGISIVKICPSARVAGRKLFDACRVECQKFQIQRLYKIKMQISKFRMKPS